VIAQSVKNKGFSLIVYIVVIHICPLHSPPLVLGFEPLNKKGLHT
jgi:hypothetical protein